MKRYLENNIVMKVYIYNDYYYNDYCYYNLLARAICKEQFINFGKCAKDNGILVVLNCRKENQESKYIYHLFFINYH